VGSGQRTFQLQPSVYVSVTVAFAGNDGICHQKRKDERLVVCYREEWKMWLACKTHCSGQQVCSTIVHDCHTLDVARLQNKLQWTASPLSDAAIGCDFPGLDNIGVDQ